jgi:hypothetical protein
MDMPKVRVREREREIELEGTGAMVLYQRNKFIDHQMTGKVVINEKDREWEQSKQAKAKFYLQPHMFQEPVLRDWQVFKQDIRKHSGAHIHQGGLVIFCLEGKGYSVVDGKRYDWSTGDLLLLPCKPGGVEHQHFNLEEGKPCKWMAFIYWPYWDMLASTMTQTALSPDYKPR